MVLYANAYRLNTSERENQMNPSREIIVSLKKSMKTTNQYKSINR